MSRIRTVGAAVSAALKQMQASRLPLQLDYFGANEATILDTNFTKQHEWLRHVKVLKR